MAGFPLKHHETDDICQNHAGEQNKHICQPVDLVERALIFLNQMPCLLTIQNLLPISVFIISYFAGNFHLICPFT